MSFEDSINLKLLLLDNIIFNVSKSVDLGLILFNFFFVFLNDFTSYIPNSTSGTLLKLI